MHPIATPHPPCVLFVTGHPASGKSSVAARLNAHLGWPLLAKDRIKERLLDVLPALATSALGPATWTLVYDTLELLLHTGSSVLVEGNFWTTEARPRLQAILEPSRHRVLEITLAASAELLVQRYVSRLADPERPTSHVRGLVDPTAYIAHAVERPYEPLNLSADVLRLDTDDWSQVPWDGIVRWVHERMLRPEGASTRNGEASRAGDCR